ncbi:peroxynitrite isomerase THAP4-like isoform X2 [Narcine bancroftii]|uniref:peroxynitrite isomerase THAP4-like isoform X2 n=1 Tax=Narcine bancroftii TaxID=1343680 RepID=UPI003831E425
MVISCSACTCTNRQGKVAKSVSFHRWVNGPSSCYCKIHSMEDALKQESWFPLKDTKRLSKWIDAVGRTDWKPTKFSFLCSAHFTKDSFQTRQEDQHQRLKFSAIPSIFNFSEHERIAEDRHRHCQDEFKSHSAPANQQSVYLLCGQSDDKGSEHLQPISTMVESEHVLERVPALGELVTSAISVASEPTRYKVADQQCTLQSEVSKITSTERLLIDSTVPFPEDATPSPPGACKLISSLHSYSLTPLHDTSIKYQVMKKKTAKDPE